MKTYDIDSLDNRDMALAERVLGLIERTFERYHRPVIRGLERIPDGPGLYVGNHNAGFLTPDTFTFCAAVYRRHGAAGLPYGLGHEVAIRVPGVHQLVVPLGAVRASHENAHRLFARGDKVLVYPGGDLDAMRPWRHRNRVVFGPRRGYIRLALRAGVPILPLVTAGAHEAFVILSDGRRLARLLRLDKLLRIEAWPITFSLPWGLTIGPPPPYLPLPTRFFQEVLPPMRFDRTGEEAAADADYVEACHQQVHGAMQQALTRLAAERLAARRRPPETPHPRR